MLTLELNDTLLNPVELSARSSASPSVAAAVCASAAVIGARSDIARERKDFTPRLVHTSSVASALVAVRHGSLQ